MLKKISLVLIVFFYGYAGINHFISPDIYLKMMPPFFPVPEALNYISGGAEVLLAILFCFPAYRKIASYTTIAMLISFFSVHFYHIYLGGLPEGLPAIPYWVLWFRIFMQFVLIAWAWWHRE
ncbi:MAG: hypothetical protein MUE81_18070 [Thermoflexibacter sp.]|jgi:uncharacterized membrane protein|nr:hypothetical protein [Thermoflexibacter sp.]